MKNKIQRSIFILFLIMQISVIGRAQPPSILTNNATYGQRYQEQIENNTAKPNAPSYNGTNSPNSQNNTSTEMLEKGYWNKVNNRQIKENVENNRVRQLLDERKKAQEQNELQQRAKEINLYDKELKQKRDLALATMVPIIANDGMNYTEAREAGEMMLFFARNNLTFPEEDYKAAASYLVKFRNSANTETFENLVGMLWNAYRYPISTTDCINSLKKRFPQKIDTLEKAELMMMCNYFGGYRPYFNNTSDPYYPESVVELLSDNDVKILYKQFHFLENKYPSLALKMAGSCRYFLNPYYYEGLLKYDLINKDDKLARFAANQKNLFSEHFLTKTNGDDDKDVIQLIEWRMRGSIQWLERNYPDYLNNLSIADWIKMAEAQSIPIKYLRHAVKEYNYNTAIWENKYAALSDAINGKINGKSSFKWDDGSYYEGDFKDGILEGKGFLKWPNGDNYVGDFKNGLKDGTGIYKYSNGDEYSGSWLNGNRIGDGVHKKVKGFYAKGTFNNGKFENVKFYNASNKEITEEEYNKSPLQKNATIKFSNNIYLGDVINGKANGKGILKFESGSIYEGDFRDNNFEGKGILKYADSAFYNGDWKNGLHDGLGTKKWKKGDLYIGEWKEGKKYGKGVYTYIDSSTYIGSWDNNSKEGIGIITYSNGDSRTGKFVNNKREGLWVYYFANKNTSNTNYVNDIRNGEYIFTKTNGNYSNGNYTNNILENTKYYNKEGKEISKDEFNK